MNGLTTYILFLDMRSWILLPGITSATCLEFEAGQREARMRDPSKRQKWR